MVSGRVVAMVSHSSLPSDLVRHVVKFGLFFGMDDFFIADSGEGLRVPIDHAQAPIDVALWHADLGRCR